MGSTSLTTPGRQPYPCARPRRRCRRCRRARATHPPRFSSPSPVVSDALSSVGAVLTVGEARTNPQNKMTRPPLKLPLQIIVVFIAGLPRRRLCPDRAPRGRRGRPNVTKGGTVQLAAPRRVRRDVDASERTPTYDMTAQKNKKQLPLLLPTTTSTLPDRAQRGRRGRPSDPQRRHRASRCSPTSPSPRRRMASCRCQPREK